MSRLVRYKNMILSAFGLRLGDADIIESELEQIDGVTAGTVSASKAVVVDANKDVGTFGVVTASSFVGNLTGSVSVGITSGATAAEINLNNDVSAFQETLTAAGAVTLSTSCRVHKFDTTLGAQTNTIPAPSAAQLGQLKILTMTVDGAADTVITLTNVTGGSAASTCTFNDVNDTLILVGGVNKWHVVKEIGVTMA